MQNLKYFVLGKKDSLLLKEYIEKYYELLLNKLEKIKNIGILESEIIKLLESKDKRNFIINADNSSIINYLYTEKVDNINQYLGDYKIYEEKLGKQINIFLSEGIDSDNLIMNMGIKIAGTNIRLTSLDNSPYSQMDAHPDHQDTGGVMGYGEKTEEEWLKVYEKTFKVLKQLNPDMYDELNQIITKIIPLGTARGLHNSASYKECVGHLYMGYTIDSGLPEINNLEAIIHESSHNKLNLLMQFDSVVLNSKEEKYYSSIRPDARHLHGVFLGVHAFAPTIYMLSEAIIRGLVNDRNWLEKFVLYYIKTKFLYKVISKHANLSEMGTEIFKEVTYVVGLIDKNFKDINPEESIIVAAKKRQMEHFSEVNNNYSNLEY